MIIPFLTPRLSSYWIDLVTRVKACLAIPLIDSHKHEAIVKDHSIRNIIPIKLRSLKRRLKQQKGSKYEARQRSQKRFTYHSLDNKINPSDIAIAAA